MMLSENVVLPAPKAPYKQINSLFFNLFAIDKAKSRVSPMF
jgi:hypothetical protein